MISEEILAPLLIVNEQVWNHRVHFGPLQFVNLVVELVCDWVQLQHQLKLSNHTLHLDNQNQIFRFAEEFVLFLDDWILVFLHFDSFHNIFLGFKDIFDLLESAFASQKIFGFKQNRLFWLKNRFYFFESFFFFFLYDCLNFVTGNYFYFLLAIRLHRSHLLHFIFDKLLDRPKNWVLVLSAFDFDSTFVTVSFFVAQVLDKFVQFIFLWFCFFRFLDNKLLQFFICILSFLKLHL